MKNAPPADVALEQRTSKTALGLPSTLKKREGLLASRPTTYICLVVFAALAGFVHWVRTDTIFACQADGYSADRYIAACTGPNFADYDHGAFAFNLEPAALSSAAGADVLFLGNSRLQIAFSSAATTDWFSAAAVRHYLMGFAYFEDVVFARTLLDKIRPQAQVYVINVDGFFEQRETDPARTILHDPGARQRYETKHLLELIHQPVCKAVPKACGSQIVVLRSRENGAYSMDESRTRAIPVSYDQAVDQRAVESSAGIAAEFLKRYAGDKCVILTMVPFVGTRMGEAQAIADRLGMKLTVPAEVPELRTFDGVHLEQASAERWSHAFFQVAGPEISSCLARQAAASR